MQPQGLGGMGGMGGSMRPPGKSGLTFDHILSRLQGELQKSQETGAKLHNLTGAMSDIHGSIVSSFLITITIAWRFRFLTNNNSLPTYLRTHKPYYLQADPLNRQNRPLQHLLPIKRLVYHLQPTLGQLQISNYKTLRPRWQITSTRSGPYDGNSSRNTRPSSVGSPYCSSW